MTNKFSTKTFLLLFVLVISVFFSACGWRTPAEGTYEFKTMQGKYEKTIRPSDGAPWENAWGDDYYTQNGTSVTKAFPVKSQTSDNARVTLNVVVTYRRITDQATDLKWINEFGLDEKTSIPRFDQKLESVVNKYAGKLSEKYSAYQLNANKTEMQDELEKQLKEAFPDELSSSLELVQIQGSPDFENDDIEQAASKVVANQKMKEASEAAYQADIVEQKRKELQAKVYENPTLYQIRLLELQKEIAGEWAKHNGTLVFNGSPSGTGQTRTQVNIQDK